MRIFLFIALLLAACAEEPTLRLRLTPDPLLNTERQVLQVAAEFVLVLDSETGFSASDDSPFVARDVDRDGVLELELRRGLAGRSELPLFELSAGSNGDRSFQIFAQGLRGGAIAAVGGLPLVTFGAPVTDYQVPFNLRSGYRPARVLFTLPRYGQSSVPSALNRVDVELSRRVDGASLSGNLQLRYQGSAGEVAVPGTWTMATSSVLELGLAEQRTSATFTLPADCFLSPGTYQIVARPGLRDLAGGAFDQDPNTDGPNGYRGSFFVPGTAAAAACSTTPQACQTDEQCNPGAATEKYSCDTVSGKCVPVSGCNALSCPKDHVCVDGGPGKGALCLPDCRYTGYCEGVDTYCDSGTGLCSPCGTLSPDPKCGTVTEQVKCTFSNTTAYQTCSSSQGGCKGLYSCTVQVTGKLYEVVYWKSSCGGEGKSVLDGTPEVVDFDCGTPLPPPPPSVSELVTCTFSSAQVTHECSSSKGDGCKGLGKCQVKVTGSKGQKVSWKSTCGTLYPSTTMDGLDETLAFSCK